MPSTLVHVAFAGMIAAALLGPYFGKRSVLVVAAFVAAQDLDAFVGLFFVAGHRTVFHTWMIPITLGALLAADTRLRDRSFVRERWGEGGVWIGWVSLVAFAVAGTGLDFVDHGVNLLWPVHDQFYVLDGKIELSDQRGIVQTFVDLDPETEQVGPPARGSSQQVNVSTGVDPDPSGTKTDPERIFPVVREGWHLLLVLVGTGVTAARFRVRQVREN